MSEAPVPLQHNASEGAESVAPQQVSADGEGLSVESRTETVVRRFDEAGALVEESTSTVVRLKKPADDSLPIGQYL